MWSATLQAAARSGATCQAHGEGSAPGPPGLFAASAFDAAVGEFLATAEMIDEVEPAREQHAVRDVGHQLPFHGRFEGACGRECRRRSLSRHRSRTSRAGTSDHLPSLRRPVVSRQEGLDRGADPFEAFRLRGDVELLVAVPADVERNDADRIAGDEVFVALDVVEREGEDAADLFRAVRFRFCGRAAESLHSRIRSEIRTLRPVRRGSPWWL